MNFSKSRDRAEIIRNFILPIIAIAVVIALIVVLRSYIVAKSGVTRLPTASSVYGDFRYEVIEVEGMPCVVAVGGNYFGITCDWSKWQGE